MIYICYHSSIHDVQSAGSINRAMSVPVLGYYWALLVPFGAQVPQYNTMRTNPFERELTLIRVRLCRESVLDGLHQI
jgi:hypothetical protein